MGPSRSRSRTGKTTSIAKYFHSTEMPRKAVAAELGFTPLNIKPSADTTLIERPFRFFSWTQWVLHAYVFPNLVFLRAPYPCGVLLLAPRDFVRLEQRSGRDVGCRMAVPCSVELCNCGLVFEVE